MKMLFLGGAFSKEMEIEILNNSKGTVHYAANQFQWTLIDGLMNVNDINLEVLSAPFIGAYPKEYSGLFYGNHSEKYKNEVECNYVSFCNLWGYRSISRKISLIKAIEKFLRKNDSRKVILVYSPHTPFLQAAVYAKQKDPSIHICLVVPDLPQYMNLNEKKSVFYTQFKKLDIKIFESILGEVDSFILITEHMKDVLKVGNRPYVVVEGAVNDINNYDESSQHRKNEEEKIKTIVYTGTLNIKFGVVNLVKAFHEIDYTDVALKICGRGDATELINEYVKKDKRIHYLGQLTNEEAIRLQRDATVLVNPRPNSEEFTKYSFPLKNMEYLLSGRPVIAFKLDGIPNEYDDYIFYFNNNTIESMKNKINEVINLSDQERFEFGSKARKFILENKNANKISLKIFDMINSNMK